MKNDNLQKMLRFFKALADESRLKIIGILAGQECSVEELAVLLELKEPTISHHLTKLKQLELVRMRPEGNTHFYQLDKKVLQTITQEVFKPEKIASFAEDVNLQTWETKVLNTYVEGIFQNSVSGQYLKEIPNSSKKRLTILKWVIDKFEMGVKYPEDGVNEILNRYYPDSETLRKELIASRLMREENGMYSRC
ncbi:metalloregulator ArsR/SmtB family transcription factor [Plectonema cf. radiosum LEGE 06105]|uniref:Metalloregulator ArsR/SmtB family transcription factor n=1 Tax=Plectonema cf. radiosum LEGE 06105 TaxID=945769 RepID=A0A8J7F3T0_9CYAN|nr:metalloregulator ArsR/SmtB family transcription factor [Plectonema radiosum]MBE9214425.1 metalloregulator ArsR/SmtB family transcription factor [Plectonema cf. radiosum LEGE 06105]